jgi:hypothetical protein
MTSIVVPICYSCTRLHPGDNMVCDAYLEGIPEAIVSSEVDHRLPYAGDGGLTFEQDPDLPEPDNTVFEGSTDE